MKLKYFIGGASHAASLIAVPPSGKRVAIRHNNSNYYASLVQPDDDSASLLNIFFDGGNYALSTSSSIPNSYYYSFNNNKTGVTVNSCFGDFGAFSKDEPTPVTTSGTEYYGSIYSITAAQVDSTLIGNAKNNQFFISSGANNVIVGGLGTDTYNFNNSSGGVITDYGIGTSINGDGTALVTSTTATAYNRTDPTTYVRSADIVKVQGTVTGLYFDRNNTAAKKTPSFTVVVTYNDSNAEEHIIVLKDIVKKPTSTGSSPIYQTNDVAAATLKIWDTSSGTQKVLSAANLRNLFKRIDTLTAEQQAQVNHLLSLNPF